MAHSILQRACRTPQARIGAAAAHFSMGGDNRSKPFLWGGTNGNSQQRRAHPDEEGYRLSRER